MLKLSQEDDSDHSQSVDKSQLSLAMMPRPESTLMTLCNDSEALSTEMNESSGRNRLTKPLQARYNEEVTGQSCTQLDLNKQYTASLR